MKKTVFLWYVEFDDEILAVSEFSNFINVSAKTLRRAIKLAIKGYNKETKQSVTSKDIKIVRKLGVWFNIRLEKDLTKRLELI